LGTVASEKSSGLERARVVPVARRRRRRHPESTGRRLPPARAAPL